ncbi:hypothetical protein DL93DRAFT_2218917 [Clavulina sp. PMI_390]|nr:hypothetical protein DL93DRAFT_2218917 [Clavulina sp. PMI_390]
MCNIPANPDAGGVGVRTAIYIQVLLPFLSILVELARGNPLVGNVSLQTMNVRSAISSTLTGVALIISAMIQHHLYGLDVFHALIVLNLCWLVVFGAFMATINLAIEFGMKAIFTFEKLIDTGAISTTKPKIRGLLSDLESLSVLWAWILIVDLILIGVFGRMVMLDPMSYDTSLDSCTSTTVFWIMGYTHSVTSHSFRKALLIIYTWLLVPGVNVSLISFFWSFFAASACYFIGYPLAQILPSRLKAAMRASTSHVPRNEFLRYHLVRLRNKMAGDIIFPLTFAIIKGIIILTTEKTIQANSIGPGENVWSLGQTFAVLVSLLPITSILQQAAKNEKPDASPGALSGALSGAPSDAQPDDAVATPPHPE